MNFLTNMPSEVWASLLGAIVGAWGSYWLQSQMEKRKQRRAQQIAVKKALLVTRSQLQKVQSTNTRFFAPFKGSAKSLTEIGFVKVSDAHMKQDYNDLSFLLVTKHYPVVEMLFDAEKQYFNFVHALKERNDSYVAFVQKSKVVKVSEDRSRVDFQAPEHSDLILKSNTDVCYRMIERATERLTQVLAVAESMGNDLFPEKTSPAAIYGLQTDAGSVTAQDSPTPKI